MNKIRIILILAIFAAAKGMVWGATILPANQTVPVHVWTSGGGGNWSPPTSNTRTISLTFNRGGTSGNLTYRWNADNDSPGWNIRLLEGGPNGTSRPQNHRIVNGVPTWTSTYPLPASLTTVVLEVTTIVDPGLNPHNWNGTIEMLDSNGQILATARFNGSSQRAGQTQQQAQNQSGSQQTFQQQWQQLQQQQLGTRLQWQGAPTTTLKARFNPKSGRVEVTMNGVITRKGYLNLMGKNLNRRQALRNYRYR